MKATVIGEVVIDRFFHADNTVTDVFGGSSANTALALHRAGVDTSLRARFSRDDAGRALRAHLERQGLDLQDAPDVTDPASIVEVRLASDGQPSYVFRLAGAADWQWTPDELNAPLPAGTSLVHAGSIASVLPPGGARIRAWLEAMTDRPMISYDPNARPAAAVTEAEADAMRFGVAAWCAIADFIKVSDEDLRWLAPGVPETEQAAAWSQGCAFVVMTKGGDGASVFVDGEHRFDVPPTAVDVIDTVGAGDTFMAWLIRGVLLATEEMSLEALAHTDDTLRNIVTLAARAAGINCARRGCNPPTVDEL